MALEPKLKEISSNPNINIFYFETRRKSESKNDFGHFLFAIIEGTKNKNDNEETKNIRLVSVCVPVDTNRMTFIEERCSFDSCERMNTKPFRITFF